MSEHRKVISREGVEVPWIIYGTAWKKEHTEELVNKAISSGFTGIDTACQPKHYREDLVGAALEHVCRCGTPRESLYLQTKFTPIDGHDPENIPYDNHASVGEQVAQSFNVSLTNLRTSYVDALILHSPLKTSAQLLEAWGAMEEIYRAGKARQLGISNCYSLELLATLNEAVTVKPAIVQNRFYQQTAYDAELRRWCRTQGVVYQSFWTLTANGHLLEDEVTRTIARAHAKTVAQVFLGFVWQEKIVPLTGTCSIEHMRENLEVEKLTLSEPECSKLRDLLQRASSLR